MPRLRTRYLAAVDAEACAAPVVEVYDLPAGEAGLVATLRVMADLIRQGQAHPIVRRWVDRWTTGIPYGDEPSAFRAVLAGLRGSVSYRPDPPSTEYLQAPWWVIACRLERGEPVALDCDDLVVLALAAFGAAGLSTRLRVVSYDPVTGEYGHVYGLVRVDGWWQPVDLAADAIGRAPGVGEVRALEWAVDPDAEEAA